MRPPPKRAGDFGEAEVNDLPYLNYFVIHLIKPEINFVH